MLICNCALAGTRACLTCPQYQNMLYEQSWQWPRPIKKITEKYDEKGKLIERIIEK